MSLRSKVFKGGSQLAFGQMAGQACSFLRNIIIARLISPSDFGIAATFAMTLSLMEMISNVAAEMQLIQSPDGDNPRLQATAQFMKVSRGFINGAILLILAVPMSRLFGVPQAKWAFACLAIFPLAGGFTHLDMFRMQREMKFMPSIWVTAGSNVLVTLVTVPLAYWLRNYSVMLWVLVLQAVSTAVGSHLVADRHYTWTWNKEDAKKILSFGWPLLVNGLLMYAIFEGDRLVIGSAKRLFPHSQFTLTDLGIYSVAFSLTMAPTMLVANVATSLFLPILSRTQDEQREFDERYLFTSQIISLVAIGITIPFILAGGWVVTLLYGRKYAAAAGFIGWLAAMWGIRIFRIAPTVAAIAKGDTQNAMFGNMARSVALIGMFAVAAVGGALTWIPICGLAGEILASAVTIWRLFHRNRVSAMTCLRPFAPFAAGMILAGLSVAEGVVRWGPIYALLTSIAITGVAMMAMLVLFPNLRQDFRSLIRNPEERVTQGSPAD